ncbi:MAG: hypothetical protein IT281_02050 [Ignavibacteria bacterium]|nr:hypothetical protein [Ignavibacteria bacterium]MCC7158302.1 hypothetical protein [Ignavibacteria bacterium]
MKNETQQVYEIISGNFELESRDILTLEDVKKVLADRIFYLLENNVEHLVQIIYRIDLNQEKVDNIFANESKEDIASLLSDAIIERQLMKVQTRMKYKSEEKRLE